METCLKFTCAFHPEACQFIQMSRTSFTDDNFCLILSIVGRSGERELRRMHLVSKENSNEVVISVLLLLLFMPCSLSDLCNRQRAKAPYLNVGSCERANTTLWEVMNPCMNPRPVSSGSAMSATCARQAIACMPND